MEKLLIRLTLGLIFVTPLFFVPFTHEYFETPKSYLLTAGGITIFFLAFATFSDFSQYLKKLTNNTLWQLLVGFLVVQTITAYFSVEFVSSFFGSQNQKNGLLMLYALFMFASLISYLVNTSKVKEEKIYQTLLYAALIASLLGILKFFLAKTGIVNFEGLFFDNREVSTFGQPNFFGFFTALAVLFIPWAGSTKKMALFYAILLFATFISFSKSGYILFGLNTIVLLVKNKNYNISKKYIGVFLISFLILLNIGLVFTKTEKYKEFIRSEQSYQYRRVVAVTSAPSSGEELRVIMLKVGIDAAQARPILGYGKGHIDSALYDLVQKTEISKSGIVDSTHNLFLDTMLEGGIFSFLLLVGIFGLLFVEAIKTRDYTKTFMLVAIVINGLIHNTSNVVYLMIFLMIGMYSTNGAEEN